MPKPKALVLTIDPDVRELEELVYSLGYEVSGIVQQNRDRPDPQWFLGRGKLAEARDTLRASDATLVIVNGDLKPNQIFNVADFLNARGNADDPRGYAGSRAASAALAADAGLDLTLVVDESKKAPVASTSERERVEVYDRLRVILEIFTERARSQEARLQVDLAKLRYEMPIVKEYIHLAKKGEHPGFLGGGQYEVNYYYAMMSRRIAKIRRDLDRVSAERDVRRKHRRKRGFHLVSLAGYTNAGKSSLLRALSAETDEKILVENRYFSTLSTRTRRAGSGKRDILVTDTVGFIEHLPPWLVEAFHSTLEEIALADVIVLTADASDPLPELERKLRASLNTLWEFDGAGALARPNALRRGAPDRGGTANDSAAARSMTEGDGNAIEAREGMLDTGDHDPPGASKAVHGRDAKSGGISRSALADDRARSAASPGDVSPAGAAATSAPNDAGSTVDDAHEMEAGAVSARDVGFGRARSEAAAPSPAATRGPGGLAPILVALNKIDLVEPADLAAKLAALRASGLVGSNVVEVSARTEQGLDAFYETLYKLLPDYDHFELALPASPASEAFLGWLYANADVLTLSRGNEVHVRFESHVHLRASVEERAHACGATRLKDVES